MQRPIRHRGGVEPDEHTVDAVVDLHRHEAGSGLKPRLQVVHREALLSKGEHDDGHQLTARGASPLAPRRRDHGVPVRDGMVERRLRHRMVELRLVRPRHRRSHWGGHRRIRPHLHLSSGVLGLQGQLGAVQVERLTMQSVHRAGGKFRAAELDEQRRRQAHASERDVSAFEPCHEAADVLQLPGQHPLRREPDEAYGLRGMWLLLPLHRGRPLRGRQRLRHRPPRIG
mmetsp:Transcript_90831/g.259853  ORF Transcript_90831/g.259853 Transcript_90831/m.259853 type:complete len:228 (+) Transcript_90831:822-1505(+)